MFGCNRLFGCDSKHENGEGKRRSEVAKRSLPSAPALSWRAAMVVLRRVEGLENSADGLIEACDVLSSRRQAVTRSEMIPRCKGLWCARRRRHTDAESGCLASRS